jgi:hypothetical protein
MTEAPAPTEAKPDLKKVPELTLHPLCEIIPACTEKEFNELKEDIREKGLQAPIKTFESKILDGRSRYKACVELEKEGHPVEFRRDYFSGDANAAVAYVISINVKRRHLSASQRALIAARLVTSQLGGDRSVKLPTEITQEQVATLAGVSTKMVTDAKTVWDYRQTNPLLAKQVLDGTLAVAKAAEQVRTKKEGEGKGKPKSGKQSKTNISYITPHDGKTALSGYSLLEEHLLDALQDVNDKSSFTHADEYARKTIEKLEKKLNEINPEQETKEQGLAD